MERSKPRPLPYAVSLCSMTREQRIIWINGWKQTEFMADEEPDVNLIFAKIEEVNKAIGFEAIRNDRDYTYGELVSARRACRLAGYHFQLWCVQQMVHPETHEYHQWLARMPDERTSAILAQYFEPYDRDPAMKCVRADSAVRQIRKLAAHGLTDCYANLQGHGEREGLWCRVDHLLDWLNYNGRYFDPVLGNYVFLRDEQR